MFHLSRMSFRSVRYFVLLGAIVLGAGPVQAQLVPSEIQWQPFLQPVSARDADDSLILIAITNDIDGRWSVQTKRGSLQANGEEGSAVDQAFWCRSSLEQSIRGAMTIRPELKDSLRFEIVKAGTPASLSGGSPRNIPKRLILLICDRQHRLLTMTVGIPNQEQLLMLIQDGLESRGSLILTENRSSVIQSVGAQSIRRVNRFYQARLRSVLNAFRVELASEGIDDDLDSPNEKTKENTINDLEDISGDPVEAIAKVKLDSTVEGDESDIEPTFDSSGESDDWESGVLISDLSLDSLEQIDQRFQIIQSAFDPLYQVDVRNRFDLGYDVLGLNRLIILEQHVEARRPWCECAIPVLIGMKVETGLALLVQSIWKKSPVRYRPLDNDLLEWWKETASQSPLALRFQPARLPPVVDAPVLTVKTKKRKRTPVSWMDVDSAISQLPNQTITPEQLAKLIHAGIVSPVDLFAPSPVRYLLFTKNRKKGFAIRAATPPVRHLPVVNRMIKQIGE